MQRNRRKILKTGRKVDEGNARVTVVCFFDILTMTSCKSNYSCVVAEKTDRNLGEFSIENMYTEVPCDAVRGEAG